MHLLFPNLLAFLVLSSPSFPIVRGAAPSTGTIPPGGFGTSPPLLPPPPGLCDSKKAGDRVCPTEGGNVIGTCNNKKILERQVNCGLMTTASGKKVTGKCFTKDGKAACELPSPCEYEPSGYRFCAEEGGQMIITCSGKKSNGGNCGLKLTKDFSLIGRCYTVNGLSNCEMIPDDGPCKDRRPGTYCIPDGKLLQCPESKTTSCPLVRGKDGKQTSGKCISSGLNGRGSNCG